METDNTNQQPQPNPSSPQIQPSLNPTPNQKGNFLIPIGLAFLILVIGVGAYYLGKSQSYQSSNDQRIQVSPSPPTSTEPTNSPSATAQKQIGITCNVSDKEFCVLLESVKSLVQAENFLTLVTYQNSMEVTCDDKARAAEGLPTYRSDNLCKGIPEGDKTKGYYIGYNQSEGSTMTAQEYAMSLKTYFTKNKPFNYVGSVIKDGKGYIVYTNTNNNYLFALPVKKYGSDWKLESVTLGVVSTDFTSLDPVILGYIR